MQKIWFFVEGESEKNLVTYLIRRKFYSCIQLEKDLLEFVKKDISNAQHHLGYCENCQNVDKIPHMINELAHLIKQSKTNLIIIICDVEKLGCFSKRKEKIENTIKSSVELVHYIYAFSNPKIEVGYWECEDIIKRIIEVDYLEIMKKQPPAPIKLHPDKSNPLFALKKSFKNYKLKYRESRFSEMFVARVDFDACNNAVLKRITDPLETACNST